jgi:fused signal recognition particle receptor
MGIFRKITSFFKGNKKVDVPYNNLLEDSFGLSESNNSELKSEIVKEPKSKPDPKSKPKTELKSIPDNKSKPEPKSKLKIETKPNPKPEFVKETKSEIISGLDKGLEKTKNSFLSKLGKVLIGKSKVGDDVLDDLEEVLITSDVGVATTIKIIENIEKRISRDRFLGSKELNKILKEEITGILLEQHSNENFGFETSHKHNPYVIMVVGVNGVGKTTTIGKLANKYKLLGKNVMLGAADTFRAGAIDQLQVWADRVGVKLVKQSMGSDPASVAFDTLKSAKAQGIDVVIIDTAGRLHNKVNLMNELTKIKRVMDKIITDSPHEVLLVLDGSTGQNAFEQAKQFSSATNVTSLAITKLDGTAKGGVVLGISHEFKIPVKYIGVGEKMEDLQFFDPKSFVDSFFK